MPFIYIMTNPAYEGYVKIGSTDNGRNDKSVEERRKELSHPEGVMFPFEVYAYYETDKNVPDKSIHDLIDTINPELRANKRREFYKMSPEKAFTILEVMAKLHNAEDKLTLVDEDANEPSERVAKKEPPFNFKSAKIPFGSELTYLEDESIKVIVKDERHITYKNTVTSVSALAKELLSCDYVVQGTLYFTYEGETLHERRVRMTESGEYK